MVVPPSAAPTASNHGAMRPTSAAQPTPTNTASTTNGGYPVYSPHIPFSMRRAPPLDMSTVERRGQPLAVRETNKRVRPHGLQEAPTFRPSEEEFADPMAYLKKISAEGRKYGICKIIPPDNWNPTFAIDTEVSGRNRCQSRIGLGTHCTFLALQYQA